uniref:Tc1-like transposase DDE domain-containing protein n=1 Tax=Ditylenchus dipsaci TaxID=166011 RepID=A0A915EID7_9BILA
MSENGCVGKKTFSTSSLDSAPAHKARETQAWCRNNLPEFIDVKQWPPYSPDLNPLDYSIWGILEAKVNNRRHRGIA